MVDRNPDDTASGKGSPNNGRPSNVGAGPGTGNPRPDYPGGSPADVRDGTLRQRPPVDDRTGPANPGLAAEGVSPNARHSTVTHSTVTPSSTRSGWSGGGMAIPALFVVVAILALMAVFL
ncbi:hypothetical protein [Azospirillum soli]|uniref:hypothetical protein n=1 Tax=Azospirillum soli TaxID=1304799 RepID=UPI001AE96ED0|nr:hypothetical protein [Azospirillum soli]